MKLHSEKEILMVVILLILFFIISILSVTNKIILNRHIRKELRIRDGLHTIFLQFCEIEAVDTPKIIASKTFWYRPMSHTIGVKNIESNYLVDAFAFLHELYHSKDRNRLLKLQSFTSLYFNLISVFLKLLASYSLLFQKYIPFLKSLLLIDSVMLLVCIPITLSIETYASKGALSFLEEKQYIEQNRLVKCLSLQAILSHVFQFIIYSILSMILFYLVE
ncbi:Uncharacterised protein [Streptococcus suis]|uniref:Uncharacterized protein n=1 Tax=Streptococcus suis TaxID=1307 RepID=A0A116M6R9_STRSU|nr:Uncharacterised protein [Streptococcus suis]